MRQWAVLLLLASQMSFAGNQLSVSAMVSGGYGHFHDEYNDENLNKLEFTSRSFAIGAQYDIHLSEKMWVAPTVEQAFGTWDYKDNTDYSWIDREDKVKMSKIGAKLGADLEDGKRLFKPYLQLMYLKGDSEIEYRFVYRTRTEEEEFNGVELGVGVDIMFNNKMGMRIQHTHQRIKTDSVRESEELIGEDLKQWIYSHSLTLGFVYSF